MTARRKPSRGPRGPPSRVSASSIRAFPAIEGSMGFAPDRACKGRHVDAALRTRLFDPSGRELPAGRRACDAVQECDRADGGQNYQDGAVGPEVPLLSAAKKPQGPFHFV